MLYLPLTSAMLLYVQIIATAKEDSGSEKYGTGIWEFSQSQQAFMDEITYGDGTIVKNLGRLDAATRKLYSIKT